ncbi:hypothetical protein PROVRUST_08296 [Providencia rustigianii DSM 4541]|uniref:Uncharacterized protein n=1 Tax=Providencia rustigianii DSM 4541 TaxID=500637 RepID=D1P7S3_9GAMM|nr:hypothetical protein PROVRUST_08296 [Providencia rustigianii DSM 4541]
MARLCPLLFFVKYTIFISWLCNFIGAGLLFLFVFFYLLEHFCRLSDIYF